MLITPKPAITPIAASGLIYDWVPPIMPSHDHVRLTDPPQMAPNQHRQTTDSRNVEHEAKFCRTCQRPVQSRRADAEFCSSACRQSAYRSRVSRNTSINCAGLSVTRTTCEGHGSRNADHADVTDSAMEIEFAGMTDDEREIFEERAAIVEFDGLLPRQEAEHLAWQEIIERRVRYG